MHKDTWTQFYHCAISRIRLNPDVIVFFMNAIARSLVFLCVGLKSSSRIRSIEAQGGRQPFEVESLEFITERCGVWHLAVERWGPHSKTHKSHVGFSTPQSIQSPPPYGDNRFGLTVNRSASVIVLLNQPCQVVSQSTAAILLLAGPRTRAGGPPWGPHVWQNVWWRRRLSHSSSGVKDMTSTGGTHTISAKEHGEQELWAAVGEKDVLVCGQTTHTRTQKHKSMYRP